MVRAIYFNRNCALAVATYAVFVFVVCEIIVYHLAVHKCVWPALPGPSARNGASVSKADLYRSKTNDISVRALFIADTHLLGPKRGHWFDKLRREWQMRQSFRALIWKLDPELVFILGDVFDEGHEVNELELDEYFERYTKIFQVDSKKQRIFALAGNHDIGFHYRVAANEDLWKRYSKFSNLSVVEVVELYGTRFVLLNSVGLEGDDCSLCEKTIAQLHQVQDALNTTAGRQKCSYEKEDMSCFCDQEQPILLQHYPLYREDETECFKSEDGPSEEEVKHKNVEKWDVVSKDSSNLVLDLLSPRLIISGHKHHGCVVLHRNDVMEISVPSFSWRNIDNPSALMVSVTRTSFAARKCHLPLESHIISLYTASGLFLVSLFTIYGMQRRKLKNCKIVDPLTFHFRTKTGNSFVQM